MVVAAQSNIVAIASKDIAVVQGADFAMRTTDTSGLAVEPGSTRAACSIA